MKSSGHNRHTRLILATLIISLGALLGILLPFQENPSFQGFRIVFGSIFILFLPGFYLTKVFFSSGEIDALERFALSFALSISVIPLLTFYANLLGMPISALNVFLITSCLIGISLVYIFFFQKHTPGNPLR